MEKSQNVVTKNAFTPFKNAAIGPQPITTVINVAQSWSIAAYLKTRLQAQSLQPQFKKAAIGLTFSHGYKNTTIDPQGYCCVVQAWFVNVAIGNAAISYSCIFGVYSHVFEIQLQTPFFVVSFCVYFNASSCVFVVFLHLCQLDINQCIFFFTNLLNAINQFQLPGTLQGKKIQVFFF